LFKDSRPAFYPLSQHNTRQGSKAFFFEKKRQKTFGYKKRSLAQASSHFVKVFWFFFQKRTSSLLPMMVETYNLWINPT
jgi:hypothetical protein